MKPLALALPTRCLCAAAIMLLAACSSTPPTPVVSSSLDGNAHLTAANVAATTTDIPPPVRAGAALTPPQYAPRVEVYSVVVNNVNARELLFALARDAKVQVDISPEINGTVILNAINQTLPQILERIARQVDMRWELKDGVLSILPDRPYLRTYHVDYVNMSREVALSSTVTPQVSSGSSGGAVSTNTTSTKIDDISKNRFWETLEKNIKDILRETDKVLPEGSSETTVENVSERKADAGMLDNLLNGGKKGAAGQKDNQAGAGNSSLQGTSVIKKSTFREAASVIINAEAGVVTVRATARQHEKIQEFLDSVVSSARRQVLIEATIAEVQLSHNYQQGVDWQMLASGHGGFTITQGNPSLLSNSALSTSASSSLGGITQVPGGQITSASGANPSSSLLALNYRSSNFAAALKLLESFGNVKVLSSPKVSVLNNQTAVINVGSQKVYFKVSCTTTASSTVGANPSISCDTSPQTAAVGFLMSVTPQISSDGSVLLNVRPSISRITDYVKDPNPAIPSGITNNVPNIDRRDMESMLRLNDGETAVLGGLMQDSVNNFDDSVPGLASLPLIGGLFSYRNHTQTKSELVIFLRPTIIKDASIGGDFRRFRSQLPDQEFLQPNWQPTSSPDRTR